MKKISLTILFLLFFSMSAQSQVKDQTSIKKFVEQQDPFSKFELELKPSQSNDQIVSPLIINNSSAAQAENDKEAKPGATTYIITLAAIGALIAVFAVFLSSGGSSGY